MADSVSRRKIFQIFQIFQSESNSVDALDLFRRNLLIMFTFELQSLSLERMHILTARKVSTLFPFQSFDLSLVHSWHFALNIYIE